MSQHTTSTISRILRGFGLSRSAADDALSTVVAQELSQGTRVDAIIGRLVAQGWSVANASYFVHYIETARNLAGSLKARDSQ